MENLICSILSNNRLSLLKKYTQLNKLYLEALDREYTDLANQYILAAIDLEKNNPDENLRWNLSHFGKMFYLDESNRIAVFHEKYGDRYFSFKNKYEISKTCISIIEQRLNDGYYENDKSEDDQQFDLFKSNTKKLTPFEKATDIINSINKDNGYLYAGRIAFYFLNSRKSYEYENFSINYLE